MGKRRPLKLAAVDAAEFDKLVTIAEAPTLFKSSAEIEKAMRSLPPGEYQVIDLGLPRYRRTEIVVPVIEKVTGKATG